MTTATAMKQQTTEGGHIMLFGKPKGRTVKASEKISKQDQEGIKRLYDALVPESELKYVNVQHVRKYFPDFDTVDVDMIAEEAFPAFEATIGVQNFEKLKRYFGIGCRQKLLSFSRPKEVDELIAKLRTIENAQYYISGYKDLISVLSKKLEGAPKELTELERAKIIRMYICIFCGYYYFPEDFSCTNSSTLKVIVDDNKVQVNNKRKIYPEELFVMYFLKGKTFADESIFYDMLYDELKALDKKVMKEVLAFAELKMFDGRITSINEVDTEQTFGSVRSIKTRFHQEPSVFAIELLCSKEHVEMEFDFGDLYIVYKLLTNSELKSFEVVKKDIRKIEGSRFVQVAYPCYHIISEVYVSGEKERNRFVRLMNLLEQKRIQMTIEHDENENLLEEPIVYDVGAFMGAIKFCNDAGYLSFSSEYERELEVASKMIEMDTEDDLVKYANGELSVQEMKQRLGIDEEFEFSYFNIQKAPETPEALEVSEVDEIHEMHDVSEISGDSLSHSDIVVQFAVQNGYVASKDEVDMILVESVLIPENEDAIEKYHEGELSDEKFERKIGFSKEFAEMFFKLSLVDVSAIEARLMEVKRYGQKKIPAELKTLILLYCFLVEEQVPCGPRMRAPKRNKALKPSNLKSLLG